ILGGKGWGFATAWLNSVGQFAVTAGIDYGLAEFLAAALGLPADRAHVLPLFAAVLVSHAALNHVGVRVVAILNWFSAWYHIAGVALLVLALATLAPLQPAGALLGRFSASGAPYAYAFAVGLLQAAWTFTGYDASAHVTEETIDPSRTAPWGIFLSVAVSGVAGWIMLAVVTLSIRDVAAAAAADNPFIFVLLGALGDRLGAAVLWIVMGAMWFCGLSSVTSNSRMLFAFARDGGLPGSRFVAQVSPRFQSPHVAVWTSATAALAVGLWADAYTVMTALSTLALYASYGMPIAASLRAAPRRGPWSLGRWSRPIRVLAVAWIVALTAILVLPPNQVAGYGFAGCVLGILVYWRAWARRWFAGPPIIDNR